MVTYKRKYNPPAPKISAEDRATGFLNSMFVYFANPQAFEIATAREIVRPTIDQYVLPERRERELDAWERRVLRDPEFTEYHDLAPFIKQVYITNPRYRVKKQTSYTITLEIVDGEMWTIGRNGETSSQPVTEIFQYIYLQNYDGVWYVTNME
jgi:hypothetical protein